MIATLKRLWTVGKQKKQLFTLIGLYCVIGCLSILRTGAIGTITQNTLSFNTDSIKYSILLLLLTAIFETILTWIANVRKAATKQAMLAEFKNHTASSILNSEFHASQALEKGDIIGRLNNDVSSIATASEMSITIIQSTIILIILLTGITLLDLRLMIAFIISIPFYFISQSIIVSKSTGNIVPWKNAMGETNALIQELLANRSTIKAFNLKPIAAQWLKKALRNTASRGIIGIGKLYVMNLIQFVFLYAPTFLVAITGAYFIADGSLSISNLVSVFLLVQIAFSSLMDITNSVQNIPQLLASTHRIFPLWDTPHEKTGTLTSGDLNADPILEFNQVCFAYPTAPDTPILQDLSFKIAPGQNIGIVGTSGSGKSTLFKLMTGLYTPTSGTIKVCGIDVESWNKAYLRDTLSVVSQNTFLFETSLFENMKLTDETLTETRALQILDSVNLKAFVNALPDGIHTNIGEKGSRLSGGQRQRLSIARSILKDAPIVLYDEATSALDAESEKEIDTLVLTAHPDKTQLVIAHRLSTIKNMNRILVLDNGHIVEDGTHPTLMANNSYYKSFVLKQEGATHEV